jgi:choline kinase
LKIIILAAGQGQRLRPLTDDRPKCLVEFNKKPLIDYIIETAKQANFNEIVVIDGYKKEILENHLKDQQVKFYTNPDFASTNMVATLFSAVKEFNDDLIISYSDIIYKHHILLKLIESDADFSVIVDKDWRNLWEIRMDNPLEDAETMKINAQGNITELGKKAKDYSEIEGQYIGLLKISKKIIPSVLNFYNSLDKEAVYDGKNFDNMFMTTFIQMVIERLSPVKAVQINGGWLEIDSIEDLERYQIKQYKI